MNRSLVTWFLLIFILLKGQFVRAADDSPLKLDDLASKASFLNPSGTPHSQEDDTPSPQGIKNKESPTTLEERSPKRIKKEEHNQALAQTPIFPPAASFLEVVSVPKECGIWCQSLDYQYDGHIISTYPWHVQSAKSITQHYETSVQTHDEKSAINFLKARIDVLFRTPQGVIKHVPYDVPFVFTSRTMNGDGYLSFGKVIKEGTSIDGRAFIEGLQGQTVDLEEGDLQADYYHTEHALLLFLLNQDNWIKTIKEGITCGSDRLECMVLVACSYYDPCWNCSRSLHRAQSLKDYYGHLIQQKCVTYGLCPASHNLNLFIEVSSLAEYQGSRECLAHADAEPYANIINIKDFFPYFAQMAMRVSLSKPLVPSYAATTVIRKTTDIKTEEEVFQEALESKDLYTEAAIYFKRLLERKRPEIKEELRKIKQELSELDELPSTPSVSDVEKFGGNFMKDFVEAKTMPAPTAEVLVPAKVEEKLLKIIYKEMKQNDRAEFEKTLQEERTNSTASTKAKRIQILGKYLNAATYGSVPGQTITLRVIDAAQLLKIYGYIYWGDVITKGEQIPHSLKENQSRKSSKICESLIDILNKIIEKKPEDPKLKETAKFLLIEMNNGKFSMIEGKYYWRKNKQ